MTLTKILGGGASFLGFAFCSLQASTEVTSCLSSYVCTRCTVDSLLAWYHSILWYVGDSAIIWSSPENNCTEDWSVWVQSIYQCQTVWIWNLVFNRDAPSLPCSSCQGEHKRPHYTKRPVDSLHLAGRSWLCWWSCCSLHQSHPSAREFWRAKKVSLHVSAFKTCMVRRTTPRAPITVDANRADYDERFTYLGQLLRKDNLCSRDVRIQHIHKCSNHPWIQAAQPRLHKSNAKSVLLQGSECWWGFQREKMEKEKIRMDGDCIPKVGHWWSPPGKQKQGRPTTTWKLMECFVSVEKGIKSVSER